MFCPKCGTQCADNAKFCISCGNPMPNSDQPAPQTTPKAPASFEATLKQNMKYVMLGIAILAIILCVMHTFSLFDVSATISYNGNDKSSSGPVSDLIESGEKPLILIGNLLFGLSNLAIAALGILYFLKENNNIDLYDKIYAKRIKLSPLFLMGVVGASAALLQILFYMMSGESESVFGYTVSASISAHWTTWIMLFVFAGLAVLDKLVLNKKAAAPVDPAV